MKLSKTFLSSVFSVLLAIGSFLLLSGESYALGSKTYISTKGEAGEFVLSSGGKSSPLYVSSEDYWGVKHALEDLRSDMGKVTGAEPSLLEGKTPSGKNIIIAGTIGKSNLIDELIKSGKLDVNSIKGEWESFIIGVVNHPFPGVSRGLVIVGSDMLGTVYGIYDVSEKIGVSPWYWWDNVPPQHHKSLYVKGGTYEEGPPSVKYRGIFLNDEWPDLTNWVINRYGYAKVSKHPPVPPGVADYGHRFYERVFDLLLRLKANYLWPAMWNNAFNEDDTLNPIMANRYGIYMGTSHQEPMMRAQKEWDRRYYRTLGPWNFAKYPDTLINFWSAGIKRNRNYREIVTIGLRGENDTPMIRGASLTEDTTLLGKIIRAQEKILADDMNPDVAQIPQLWCPYDEVLSYYMAGFRVPDYVTILWTDDNYGNIRRLPTPAERLRSGGAGIYYHFDLHGGPRSYQWINSDPLPKIWDQMSLAKEYGADRIWIVNVGHLKGYSLPISYFMDLAWNTNCWTNGNIVEYARMWARQQFGPKYADGIADILMKYSKYNGRRKPELLSPKTYSLVNYNEAADVVSDFRKITEKAEKIYRELPSDEQPSFYELVLFPTKASYILNDMYYAAARNELYAKQGRAETNDMAAETRTLFSADTSMMWYFNHKFENGEWNGFMDQPFIGYKTWSQPKENNLGMVKLASLTVPDSALMGVAVQGSKNAWPSDSADGVLPQFDPYNRQTRYIDIFNRGSMPFKYSVKPGESYVHVSLRNGKVESQSRVLVSVDWKKAPGGTHKVPVYIKQAGTDREVVVYADVTNPAYPGRDAVKGFVEGEGFVSIEAAHYSKLTNFGKDRWEMVQDYGRTLSGMRATAPADAPSVIPGKNAPCLEYRMYLFDTGKVSVEGIFSPTLNFNPNRELKYAVAFDGQTPQIVTLVPKGIQAYKTFSWVRTVFDNARFSKTSWTINKPGYHTLKIWMIDPGPVLENLVVNLGGVRKSYLGPPESFHRVVKSER